MEKSLPTSILTLIAALSLALPANAGDIVVVMGQERLRSPKIKFEKVYLGRNNSLNPIDLPESNPLREAFYKKATDRVPAQVKAVWSRLTFTGQGQPPKELSDAAAIKKAVAADPKAVGYIDRADLDASVKVVLVLN